MFLVILLLFFYFGIAIKQVFTSPKFGKAKNDIEKKLEKSQSVHDLFKKNIEDDSKRVCPHPITLIYSAPLFIGRLYCVSGVCPFGFASSSFYKVDSYWN